MDPRQLYADERFTGVCVYCGGKPATRDHVPSRVLLDEPFPDDLPVVPACDPCNNSFSLDEQYLACLLECVMCGTVDPGSVRRDKIKRLLTNNVLLASRIEASCNTDETGNLSWQVERERVQNVITILARGHAAYEYSEPQFGEPENVSFFPISLMTEEQLNAFEAPPVSTSYPEIGSRAFQNIFAVGSEAYVLDSGWQVVQERRYRYAVSHSDGIQVRMVINDYLACEVVW